MYLICLFRFAFIAFTNFSVDLSATYEKIQKQTDALFALYERYAEQLTVEDVI